MKKLLISAVSLILCIAILLVCTGAIIGRTAAEYTVRVGLYNYNEKITGTYLVSEAAKDDNTVTIFGSSELRTFNINTHPSYFFLYGGYDININLVGRGSCQSLIHALSIAASGDSLTGKKVVLITSPQSYVKDGITPDMFMANFSEQQYLEIMLDSGIPGEVKDYISGRVDSLTREYDRLYNGSRSGTASGVHAAAAGKGGLSGIKNTLLTPYYMLSKYALGLKDVVTSSEVIKNDDDSWVDYTQIFAGQGTPTMDNWESSAELSGKNMTDNNDFGILNDYYTTYIGRRLETQKGKDSELSYSESKEYDDLKLLLEVCRIKGIEPLFVHVPLHGEWSDYTGFSAERRAEYYDNVRKIVNEYGVDMLDLTEYEYEKYFLCDIMHLGWKGWLEVDKTIIEYFAEG